MADEEIREPFDEEEEDDEDDVLRCPKCWSRDIVPAAPRGLWDRVMAYRSKVPCQCRGCAHRFYRPGDPATYFSAWTRRRH